MTIETRPSLRVLVVLGLAATQAWAQAPEAPTARKAHASVVELELPAVELVRDDGKVVPLAEELGGDRPVVLNFIFTSCGTICPVMSQTFARLQGELGREPARLVSITLDPEHDTPARLAAYAKSLHAGPSWHFYSSSAEGSVAAQRAFQVYRGDKMDHTPVAFIRAGAGRHWVRVDGFASAAELAAELRHVIATR